MTSTLQTWGPLLLVGLLSCSEADDRSDTGFVRPPVVEPEEPKLKPFEDIAPSGDAASRSTSRPFSDGLAERSVWKRALATAAEAQTHFDLAQQAHRDADREVLNREGREAKRLFDQALEDTAEFEEELVAEYDEDDPQARDIIAQRNVWFDRLRWLHKTVGR